MGGEDSHPPHEGDTLKRKLQNMTVAVQNNSGQPADNAYRFVWPNVSNDVGEHLAPRGTDPLAVFVQSNGTGTVEVELSADGVTWVQARDVGGNVVSIVNDGYVEISTAAGYIRPKETSGTGTSTVQMVIRR